MFVYSKDIKLAQIKASNIVAPRTVVANNEMWDSIMRILRLFNVCQRHSRAVIKAFIRGNIWYDFNTKFRHINWGRKEIIQAMCNPTSERGQLENNMQSAIDRYVKNVITDRGVI